MTEGTQNVILVVLFLFVLSGFSWPLLVAMQQEMEQREKELGGLPRFDERQQLARLRAGCRSLAVLVVFLVLWAALDASGRFSWTGGASDVIVCALLLAWLVWVSDCTLHDAIVGWKEKEPFSGILLVTTLNLVNALRAIEVIKSKFPVIFAWCIAFAYLGVLLYKHFKSRRKTGDEGGEEDAL